MTETRFAVRVPHTMRAWYVLMDFPDGTTELMVIFGGGAPHTLAKREQGEVTVENAHKLVDDSICALLDANELLGCMIKDAREKDGRG